MKDAQKFFIILTLLFFTVSNLVLAESKPAESPYFFSGLGGAFGWDLNVLKSPGGGVGGQCGYRFNKIFSLMAQSDMYYTKDSSVDYFAIPIQAAVKLNFFDNFFAVLGGGYYGIIANEGRHFRDTRNHLANWYHGYGGHAGAGSDFWVSEKVFISPQVDFTYARAGSIDRLVPAARVYFGWKI